MIYVTYTVLNGRFYKNMVLMNFDIVTIFVYVISMFGIITISIILVTVFITLVI